MSRKPTIKISYPEASDVAMKLTEAMVRRAPGRRVVETTSEDSTSPAGGELFADFDACSTSTSVDLTLTLNSASMDYALETLIRPNLTADERKRILGDSASGDDLLSPAQAAAADASTCTDEGKPSTAEVRSASLADETVEVGKISDKELRNILTDMIVSMDEGTETADAIDTAVNEINHRAGMPSGEQGATTQSGGQEETVKVGRFTERALRDILNEMVDTMEKGHGTFDAVNHAVWAIKELAKAARREVVANAEKPIEEDLGLVDQLAVLICGAQRVTQKCTTPLKLFATDIDHYIKESFDDEAEYVITARALARVLSDVQGNFAEDPKLTFEKALKIRAKARADFEGLKKDLDELNKKEPSWDDVEKEAQQIGKNKADKIKETDDIESGLLNDIDEDKSSTAEVRSDPLADEEGREE